MTQRAVWLAVVGMQLFGLHATAEAKNCQTAADCGGAPATCELFTYQTCAGADPACPAGSPCGDKPTMDNQTSCAPYVEGICRQPYELPCKADVDCGVGFNCVEQIGQWCMGWSTTGGNGVPPMSHEECHESRGTFACELIKKSCSEDSQCAANLRCLQSEPSACGGSVAMTDSPTIKDEALPEPKCAEPPKLCAPKGYFGDLESTRDDVIVDEADGKGGTVVNDTSLPAANEASAADEPADPAKASDGCALATQGPATFELTWLALATALALKRRRHPHA